MSPTVGLTGLLFEGGVVDAARCQVSRMTNPSINSCAHMHRAFHSFLLCILDLPVYVHLSLKLQQFRSIPRSATGQT